MARRRVDPRDILSWELAKETAAVAHEFQRQLGLLIDRKGEIDSVWVGDARNVRLPKHLDVRSGSTRLAGVRWIRTDLASDGIDRSDTTSLLLHRLDLVAVLEVDRNGFPGSLSVVHISPDPKGESGIRALNRVPADRIGIDFTELIAGLENDLRRNVSGSRTVGRGNRAILCALDLRQKRLREEDLHETRELARTAGVEIVDTIVQHRDRPDPKYCVGEGKIEEISSRAIRHGADLLLFQENLSPNQIRHLYDRTERKVLDRTQLILDIFAQRAKSHDGKLQVELAQLRYTLPRLREKESMLSRLVGGIGGRGPGETKLEIHRRRAKDRIHRLEKEIEGIALKRASKRGLRDRRSIPVVSIVGYTNAGKSTLLNTLTGAAALAEDRLFATLDPFSKRLRFPKERELILTDTVGFIRDLPKDLIAAFRATLEEIGEADALVHVVDVSDEHHETRIHVVHGILEELGYGKIPRIMVFNKTDRVDRNWAERVASRYEGVTISAIDPATTPPLLTRIEGALFSRS
jgi:GTP-binding protein HflX